MSLKLQLSNFTSCDGPTNYPNIITATGILACFSVGPKIDVSFLQDKHVSENGMVSVVCLLTEGDPSVEFQWSKDGKWVNSLPGVKVVNQEFSSTLTITDATSVHSGNYCCRASNPVSWSMLKATIFVDGTVDL